MTLVMLATGTEAVLPNAPIAPTPSTSTSAEPIVGHGIVKGAPDIVMDVGRTRRNTGGGVGRNHCTPARTATTTRPTRPRIRPTRPWLFRSLPIGVGAPGIPAGVALGTRSGTSLLRARRWRECAGATASFLRRLPNMQPRGSLHRFMDVMAAPNRAEGTRAQPNVTTVLTSRRHPE